MPFPGGQLAGFLLAQSHTSWEDCPQGGKSFQELFLRIWPEPGSLELKLSSWSVQGLDVKEHHGALW
jgi:hypothetical protein